MRCGEKSLAEFRKEFFKDCILATNESMWRTMSAAEVIKRIERAAAEKRTELYLSGQELTAIPKEIYELSHLTTLELGRNKILEIPEAIAQLTNLKILNLGRNLIRKIPEAIAQLTNLQELYFSENQITEIPEAITELSKLTKLSLFNNQIKKIPEAITNLADLTTLYLNGNQITEIPETITKLPNLKTLSLINNEIEEIPEAIAQFSSLKNFYISENPITNIPGEVLAQGSEGILNFLRQTFEQEKQPLHEAKMLLVGQGSVGKTSLIKRLLYNSFDKDESQTDGLDVQTWKVDINEKNIRLNVWDFGGQEIYHATHQFFLTKRSLYVLVCNCRTSEEENRLEYWLKLIQTFGDASPVIIVGNKKDEQPLDINRKALREKYPNICTILETSCQSGDGIQELKDEIYQQVAKLKEVYDLLPMSWFKVKEQLEAMTEDFISYNRYLGICHENQIPEEYNQEQLIDLLHRLGLVLNFREHPLLQQTNVLKPEWATEGIYALLSDDKLKTESKGIFKNNDLVRILEKARYPKDRHEYLIELMKEFELCFELDCDPPRFLIPGILPKDEPEATDLDGEILEFQYHYRVLPNSIISRFIVNTHEKIHDETYWRSGVMLVYEEGDEPFNIARVKADPEENKIFIAISGKPETRRTFLGLIRDVFNKLHRSFGNLEITEWVPVPDHPNYVLKYSDLLGLEGMGETHKIIGELRLKLELRKLLDGYESLQQRQQARNEAARIDKQYNFYGNVRDPDFYGGSKMTGDQPNISINADNIGIASMSGGTIESGAIVAGQYNEGSSDLEDLLKLIALMKEAVPFFPEEKQEDLTIELDDMETEVKKPKDKRRVKKIKNCLTALATAGTVAIASLTAANEGFEQIETFVDNANTLANKFDIELAIPPAQQP